MDSTSRKRVLLFDTALINSNHLFLESEEIREAVLLEDHAMKFTIIEHEKGERVLMLMSCLFRVKELLSG